MRNIRFLPAIVLAGVLASTSACATGYAQGVYRDRGPYDRGSYGNGGYYRDIERRAYDIGFREGLRQGERDGRGRHRFDPRGHGDWRSADDGYRREYGDRNFYRQNFRNGYEAGYSQGYRQYDRGRRW